MDQADGSNDPGRGSPASFLSFALEADVVQRALANQPWKEYTAEGGRKYWYNTESTQSSWEMPEAYKDALAQTAHPSKLSMP